MFATLKFPSQFRATRAFARPVSRRRRFCRKSYSLQRGDPFRQNEDGKLARQMIGQLVSWSTGTSRLEGRPT